MNNISRLSRKNRTDQELGILSEGGILDLFDNEIKLAYRLNDEEYDYLAEKMTSQEISLFVEENKSFTQKREVIILLEKYLKEYYNEELI